MKPKTKKIGYTWNKVILTFNESEQIWDMSAHDFSVAMGDAMAETIDYDRLESGNYTDTDLTNVVKFLFAQYFDIEVGE